MSRKYNIHPNDQHPLKHKVSFEKDGCYSIGQLYAVTNINEHYNFNKNSSNNLIARLKKNGVLVLNKDYKRTCHENTIIYFESAVKKIKEYLKIQKDIKK